MRIMDLLSKLSSSFIGRALFASALGSLAFLVPAAHADLTFGPSGSAAGQTSAPGALAVDSASGNVYVADDGNNRVAVFDEDGDFMRAFGFGVDTGANALEVCTTASSCQAGIPGTAGGQFESVRSVAVDNDPASPSYQDVYVFGNARVQRFTPAGAFVLAFGDGVNQTTGGDVCTAALGHVCKAGTSGTVAGQLAGVSLVDVGPGGVTHVLGPVNRVQKFDSSGAFVTQLSLLPEGLSDVKGLSVDSAGNFYTGSSGTTGAVRKYDSSGALLNTFNSSFNIQGLSADYSSGEVFVADVGNPHISVYDPAGSQLSVIVGEEVRRMTAVAARSTANGDVYAIHDAGANTKILHIPVPPPGPFVLAGSTNGIEINRADPIGNTQATLNTVITPEGNFATYHFEYVTEAEFGANGFTNAQKTAELPVANEVQRVFINATAGQFNLTFGADTTGDLPFDASAAQVEAALRALPSIGSPNVVVTCLDGFVLVVNCPDGVPVSFRVTFTGTLENTDVDELIISDGTAPLSGGSGTPATSVQTQMPGGATFEFYGLASQITGLSPETTYRFRAVATDGTNTAVGPTASFATREPFELGDTYSTEVGTGSALLHAELNPLGIDASGYFEYVDDATYQASGFTTALQAPDVAGGDPPLDFGDGENEITRSLEVQSLSPDTLYHYRFVAENSFGTELGLERTLHTFPLPDPPVTDCPNHVFRGATPSLPLPDCRAYEMVSPVDKEGGEIAAVGSNSLQSIIAGGDQAHLRQASPKGESLTYSSSRAFAEPEAAPWTSQYLAVRDPDTGWQSEGITPPGSADSHYILSKYDNHFQAFGTDLCNAFYLQDNDVALAPGDQAGYPDLYRRRICDPMGYDLLTTAAPIGSQPPADTIESYFARVQGFSADGGIAVFRANAKLTPSASSATNGPNDPIYQLYLEDGKGLRLVSVLPNGGAAGVNSSVGRLMAGQLNYRPDVLARAVSEDGTRVFWSSPNFEDSKLYVRVNSNQAQSKFAAGKCSEPAKACTLAVSGSVGPAAAEFLTATPDGSKVLFTYNPLASGDLYSYDVASQTPSLIATGVQGLLGTSEDLTKIYLVSTAVLDAGANAGKNNIYLYEEGQGFTYIATLGLASGPSYLERYPFESSPYRHLSRVSSDGTHLAFDSSASLTGYDNAEATSGVPATEVFLYDSGSDQLRCVSCNPSGARPTGRIFPALEPARVAAYIPGWEYSLHASRVLSEDGGRLFFESFDALLPTDTNGAADVYQWEAPGTGDCDVADASYFVQNGGCLSLVSSGQSPADSNFVDASSDGSDVFLLSRERLHGADVQHLDRHLRRPRQRRLPGSAEPLASL